jgi:quinol-cytochrome oxidoreductase complex cytochrome b subunit
MSATQAGWFREWVKRKKGKAIPSHVTFFHCFGGFSLALIILQVITGVFMLFFYTPEPDKALYSIERMSNDVTLGWLFRNLHRWTSTLLLATVFSHMVIVFYYKAYQSPREFTWASGILQLLMVFLLVVTGILLPWDWRAYWSFTIWMDYIDTWFVFGETLKESLLDVFSLNMIYYAHVLVIPLLLAGLLYLHFKMVRRHGISEPL